MPALNALLLILMNGGEMVEIDEQYADEDELAEEQEDLLELVEEVGDMDLPLALIDVPATRTHVLLACVELILLLWL